MLLPDECVYDRPATGPATSWFESEPAPALMTSSVHEFPAAGAGMENGVGTGSCFEHEPYVAPLK